MSSDPLLPKLHAIGGLRRGSLLCYYPATATQLATDSPLSKWCIAHRPPFPDSNALKYTPLPSKVPPLFHVSCYFICKNVEHSLCGHNWCPAQRIFCEIPKIPCSPSLLLNILPRPFSSASTSLLQIFYPVSMAYENPLFQIFIGPQTLSPITFTNIKLL